MKLLLTAAALALLASGAQANVIRSACLNGERPGTSRLCTCIQSAADRTLTRRDQRLAASFFRDPDRAQEIRQSSKRDHEVFWQRYKTFGAFAETVCR